jgi:hypothetical protein
MLVGMVHHRRGGLQARKTQQNKDDKDPERRRASRQEESSGCVRFTHIAEGAFLRGRCWWAGRYSDSGARIR